MAPLPLSGFANVTRFSGSRNEPGLLLRRGGDSGSEVVGTGAEPLVQPDVAVRRDVLSDTGVTGPMGGGQVPLEALVQSYVSSRRETYMAQGWQRFKERQYRVATGLFSMADSVSVSEPASRIPIKRAIVVAGLASRQYSLAANALAWLLSDDPISKTTRDPAVLENLAGFAANYGTSEECQRDWAEHTAALVALANANPGSADTQALRVILLWGQNDRSAAEFYARKLSGTGAGESGAPWGRLLTSLQAAGESRPAARPTATGPAIITMGAPAAAR